MFGRKKPEKVRQRSTRTGTALSQFGLMDIPDLSDVNSLSGGLPEDDDEDLEAELLALTSDNAPPPKPRKVNNKEAPQISLDTMIEASMKDIPSDESISGDEDDPELLDELSEITGGVLHLDNNVENTHLIIGEQPLLSDTLEDTHPIKPIGTQQQLLVERLSMYKEAENKALSVGESARARRFNRGVKTLGDLIKQVASGKSINEEDIPPPLALSTSSTSSIPTEPAPPSEIESKLPTNLTKIEPSPPKFTPEERQQPLPSPSPPATKLNPSTDTLLTEKSKTLLLLTERRDQYKRAALHAKKAGNVNLALDFVKTVKKFETVISGVEADQPVDLSEMPPPPPSMTETVLTPIDTLIKRRSSESQRSSELEDPLPKIEPPASSEAEVEEYLVDMPKTILEALEQRLEKYQSQENAAKTENNSSKVRRMGRIVKQYTDAIKQHKAGKPVEFEELPTPPGYPPIPLPGATTKQQSEISKPATTLYDQSQNTKNALITSDEDSLAEKPNVRKLGGSRQEKQLSLLIAKQKQFKLAALEAKRKGEISQAKEYLRLAKGFDRLIEASNCGLPVDMNSVPVSPENKILLESDFDVVSVNDCSPGSDSDIYDKLEADLLNQLKKFMETRNHFKAIGDVTSANRFEQQALSTKKDLDFVKFSHKNKHPVPKFHYEMKSFSIVQCNTELGDNDVELTLVQGINYNVPNPKEVDTYIRFEFPYPNEDPFRDKTSVIYNTNNPVYDEKFTIPIQRNARACQRIFKRQTLKCEVWAKGGFFRSDCLIGTASVKLQPLENVCVIHDSFNLMDGRKAVGGKLEVKIRVRNPILTKQIEQVQEKWLVIDS